MSPRAALARLERVGTWIGELRADDARRRGALLAAVVLGLGLARLHWSGLVVAGALVGLTRRGLARAVGAAAGFGLLAVALTVALAPTLAPGEFVALTPLNYVTVALALVLPAWGALTRSVV